MRETWLRRARAEGAQAGLGEFIDAKRAALTGNPRKAIDLLRKGRRLAQKANEPAAVQYFQEIENILALPPMPFPNLLDDFSPEELLDPGRHGWRRETKTMSADANTGRVAMVTADPYRALGIERAATEAEINRAYFQLVRQFPPERSGEIPGNPRGLRAARDPAQRGADRPLLAATTGAFVQAPHAHYDLAVHPLDLIALMTDAVAPPMSADFATSIE